MKFIGREFELRQVNACLKAGRHVLLEGPVGVGKTQLALTVSSQLNRPVFRVDGDSRYTEQKLSGHFDPPSVMAKGYCEESFIPGPLIEAIRLGGVLLINEMNRLPEGVQNVLLPALDEGIVSVPRLGKIQARPGFVVIATQNPKEFVATAQLSEAILDRFEWVSLGYQSQNEEIEIVLEALSKLQGVTGGAELASQAVAVVRATRNDPRVRRGASVRAAIAIAEVAAIWVAEGKSVDEAIQLASKTGLPTRMEWAESAADPSEREKALDSFMKVEQVKKKN